MDSTIRGHIAPGKAYQVVHFWVNYWLATICGFNARSMTQSWKLTSKAHGWECFFTLKNVENIWKYAHRHEVLEYWKFWRWPHLTSLNTTLEKPSSLKSLTFEGMDSLCFDSLFVLTRATSHNGPKCFHMSGGTKIAFQLKLPTPRSFIAIYSLVHGAMYVNPARDQT